MINEGRTFAVLQLRFTHKQMDCESFLLVLDNVPSSFVARCCGILALPMKGAVIDPMIDVPMVCCLALLIQRYQQHHCVLAGQRHMPDVSIADAIGFAK